eukprot:3621115-Rhodomonas_salina.1
MPQCCTSMRCEGMSFSKLFHVLGSSRETGFKAGSPTTLPFAEGRPNFVVQCLSVCHMPVF